MSNISFTDRDCDALELGGTIAWLEPSDAAPERVKNYKVQLATEVSGTLRLRTQRRQGRDESAVDASRGGFDEFTTL